MPKKTIVFSVAVFVAVVVAGILNLKFWEHRTENAQLALAQKGYTAVHVGSWYPWCMKGEIGSRFTAVSPKNNATSGHICYAVWYSRVSQD
jgi:hypothetical protein